MDGGGIVSAPRTATRNGKNKMLQFLQPVSYDLISDLMSCFLGLLDDCS